MARRLWVHCHFDSRRVCARTHSAGVSFLPVFMTCNATLSRSTLTGQHARLGDGRVELGVTPRAVATRHTPPHAMHGHQLEGQQQASSHNTPHIAAWVPHSERLHVPNCAWAKRAVPFVVVHRLVVQLLVVGAKRGNQQGDQHKDANKLHHLCTFMVRANVINLAACCSTSLLQCSTASKCLTHLQQSNWAAIKQSRGA